TPTSGRSAQEYNQLIGYFVNPVVIRGNLQGNPSVTTFFQRLREQILGAMAHQEYPFPELVKQLAPQRDANRLPIYQVSLSLQKPQTLGEMAGLVDGGKQLQVAWDDLTIEAYEIAQNALRVNLGIEIVDTP